MEYKKKPLLLKIKEYLKDIFYDYNDKFIVYRWYRHIRYLVRWKILHPRNKIHVKTLDNGYHDIVELMLHANFAMLVDFVENEWGIPKKNKIEDMMLDIEASRKEYATYDAWTQEEKDKNLQFSIDQNNRYMEIYKLYVWWTQERPNRKELEEPQDVENWEPFSTPIESSRDEYGDPKYYELGPCPPKRKAYYAELRKQEEAWTKEDNDNLAKLISHRQDLWT